MVGNHAILLNLDSPHWLFLDYSLGHECYSGRALTPYIGLKFCDVVMVRAKNSPLICTR